MTHRQDHRITATHADVVRALEQLAATATEAAYVRLEATPDSILRARTGGASDDLLDSMLVAGCHLAQRLLPSGPWSRTSWSSFASALAGTREELAGAATRLVAYLPAHPNAAALVWRVILTRVLPADPLRTLQCDPGYDLAPLTGSYIAFVEPYPGDDWRSPGRYPTTSVIWKDA